MNKHLSIRKAQTAVIFLTLATFFLLAGALLRFVPSETALGPIARVLDSAAPHLLVLSLGCSLLAAVFGFLRAPFAVVFLVLVSVAFQVVEHRKISLPMTSGQPADMRILFLNVLSSNDENGSRIVEAALSFDPDVIVFAESRPVLDALDQLRDQYAFLSPCDAQDCELLVAAKLKPKRFWRLSLNSAWDNRYAVAEFELQNGKRFFLASNHLVKPWLSGIAESELARLAAQYNWLSGPSVVVGDFNAAPWSRPMLHLLSSRICDCCASLKGRGRSLLEALVSL